MKIVLPALAALVIAAPAAAQVMTPADYVAAAGASDLYERQSSQTVLESTQDPKIRQFAQMMIGDHTKSTADVKAAAARSRVRAAPPRLTPVQTELVAELRAETGAARRRDLCRAAEGVAQSGAGRAEGLCRRRHGAGAENGGGRDRPGRPAPYRDAEDDVS